LSASRPDRSLPTSQVAAVKIVPGGLGLVSSASKCIARSHLHWQLEVGNRELERQLSRLAGFNGQVRVVALDAVHCEAQKQGAVLSRVRGRGTMSKVRLRGHVHGEPLQLHHGNLHRLARPVTQWRVKAELVDLYEGLDEGPDRRLRRARRVRSDRHASTAPRQMRRPLPRPEPFYSDT